MDTTTDTKTDNNADNTDPVKAINAVLLIISDYIFRTENGLYLPKARKVFSPSDRPAPLYTWKGADVVVTANTTWDYRGGSTLVVTQYAEELKKLLELVRDSSRGVVDYYNKLELYPRLADAANKAMSENPEITLQELTLAVLAEWQQVFGEWRDYFLSRHNQANGFT